MENKTLSLTFKNDYQSFYEANYAYAIWKGNLSKKHMLKMMISAAIIPILIALLMLFENEQGFDTVTLISLFLLISFFTLITYFLTRMYNKSLLKNYCKSIIEQRFDSKTPKKAELDEEKMTIMGGYSVISVPYEEIDFVISDRINFVFKIGSDTMVRNIPKINQNPDVLFAADELFKEKLGERFIYKM